MVAIEFTDNHQDLSTENGFQFKFLCERCGDGYLSTFQPNTVGILASIVRFLGQLFGGVLGRVSHGSYEVQRAIGGAGHDRALQRAVTEISLLFRKCRRCGDWMCAQSCWNDERRMCKRCAPVGEEEETALRDKGVAAQVASDMVIEEEERVRARAAEVEARCPACGAATLGKKFCPGCGKKLQARDPYCPTCNARLTPGARFCGDCGTEVAS